MKSTRAIWKTIIILAVISLILYGLYRLILFLPIFPQKVPLPDGSYLPAASVYMYDTVRYDPLQPPLDSQIARLNVDRSAGEVVIQFLDGQELAVPLGKVAQVIGCEHQFSMEYLPLSIQELRLGSVHMQDPILMVSCEMWARSEKLRPAKLILREGPLQQGDPFVFGTLCQQPEEICLYFGQEYGTLVANVIDAQSGQPLPGAQITLENGMGIQKYTGEFKLPLYAGVQVKFTVSAPGYPDLNGQIANRYADQLMISFVSPIGQAGGFSQLLDMPSEDLELPFSFRMGETGPQ